MPVDAISDIMALAKRVAGINLTEAKRTLVEGRLAKRLRVLGIDIAEYAQRVVDDVGERGTMLDLLSTNHTAFWREPAHFIDLTDRVLPALAKARAGIAKPRLRLWCAAAATGEEAYTVAMCVRKALRDVQRWDAAILATDISNRALGVARQGVYAEERVAALSAEARRSAFAPHAGAWRVRDDLRSLLHFAHLNLMDPWPMRGPFDAIFCRNVMIYFDDETRNRLVVRLARLLAPGGTLYVGQSESLNAMTTDLRYHAPAVYCAA